MRVRGELRLDLDAAVVLALVKGALLLHLEADRFDRLGVGRGALEHLAELVRVRDVVAPIFIEARRWPSRSSILRELACVDEFGLDVERVEEFVEACALGLRDGDPRDLGVGHARRRDGRLAALELRGHAARGGEVVGLDGDVVGGGDLERQDEELAAP